MKNSKIEVGFIYKIQHKVETEMKRVICVEALSETEDGKFTMYCKNISILPKGSGNKYDQYMQDLTTWNVEKIGSKETHPEYFI